MVLNDGPTGHDLSEFLRLAHDSHCLAVCVQPRNVIVW